MLFFTSGMKAKLEGNKIMISKVVLCEEGISGASLNEKDISKLTVSELKSIATVSAANPRLRFHV